MSGTHNKLYQGNKFAIENFRT